MTRAALRGGRFLAGNTSHARTRRRGSHGGGGSSLMYFYVHELDKAGHRYAASRRMGAPARRAGRDRQQAELHPSGRHHRAGHRRTTACSTCRNRSGSTTPPTRTLIAGVRHTAGEPRMVHLYLDEGTDDAGRLRLLRGLAGPLRRPDLGIHPGRSRDGGTLRRGPRTGRPADRRRDDRRPRRRWRSTTPARVQAQGAGSGGPARLADQGRARGPAAVLPGRGQDRAAPRRRRTGCPGRPAAPTAAPGPAGGLVAAGAEDDFVPAGHAGALGLGGLAFRRLRSRSR